VLEGEVEMLTKEVRELRRTGAGVHGLQERMAARVTEQLRDGTGGAGTGDGGGAAAAAAAGGGSRAAGVGRPHSLPPSPRALLPQPVADVYDRYSGAGAKANLQAEMKRLEEHKKELAEHQRDLAAAEWLAAERRRGALTRQQQAEVDYSAARDRLKLAQAHGF
jgi:hypothetical protein